MVVCVCAYARGTCERKLAKRVRESVNKCERRERKWSEICEGMRGRENESEREREREKERNLLKLATCCCRVQIPIEILWRPMLPSKRTK